MKKWAQSVHWINGVQLRSAHSLASCRGWSALILKSSQALPLLDARRMSHPSHHPLPPTPSLPVPWNTWPLLACQMRGGGVYEGGVCGTRVSLCWTLLADYLGPSWEGGQFWHRSEQPSVAWGVLHFSLLFYSFWPGICHSADLLPFWRYELWGWYCKSGRSWSEAFSYCWRRGPAE